MLELFSIVPEQIQYACRTYRPYSQDTTSIVEKLIRQYRKEDVKMATTLNDIYRKILREAPVKDRLEGLTSEDIRKVMPLEELLKGVSREEIEKHLKRTNQSKQKPKKARKSQP